ncbi:hypothetical protein [Streptomyces sp. NPDC056160]|uniref:hypothetical protein n=1 Tax=Streptomyces sp. NPDC056160 TaxID=3345731 RepID=UPI0035E1FAD6
MPRIPRNAVGRAGAVLAVGFLTALTLVCLLWAFGDLTPHTGHGQDDAHRAQTLDDEFTQLQADQEIVVISRRAANAAHATARDRARYTSVQHSCRQHAARYNADASRGWVPANLPDHIATADFCGN